MPKKSNNNLRSNSLFERSTQKVDDKPNQNNKKRDITVLLNRFNKKIITSFIETSSDEPQSSVISKENLIKLAINLLTEKFSDWDELILFLQLRYIQTQKQRKSWKILEIKDARKLKSDLTAGRVSYYMKKYFTKYKIFCKLLSEKKGDCIWTVFYLEDGKPQKPAYFITKIKLSLVLCYNLPPKYTLIAQKVVKKAYKGSVVEDLLTIYADIDYVQRLNIKVYKSLHESLVKQDKKETNTTDVREVPDENYSKITEQKVAKCKTKTAKGKVKLDENEAITSKQKVKLHEKGTRSTKGKVTKTAKENFKSDENGHITFKRVLEESNSKTTKQKIKLDERGTRSTKEKAAQCKTVTTKGKDKSDENEATTSKPKVKPSEKKIESIKKIKADVKEAKITKGKVNKKATRSIKEKAKQNEKKNKIAERKGKGSVSERVHSDESVLSTVSDEHSLDERCDLPKITELKYVVKSNLSGMEENHPSVCFVKFQGTNIMKGIEKLVEYQMADSPLPDYLCEQPKSGKTEYMISM